MTRAVLDASAVLAFLRNEPGADVVRPHLRGGLLSAVNLTEVFVKSASINIASHTTASILDELGVVCVPFDETHAAVTASLLPPTKSRGLSLADRACLALGKLTRLPVLTADHRWKEVKTGVDVRLIRKAK